MMQKISLMIGRILLAGVAFFGGGVSLYFIACFIGICSEGMDEIVTSYKLSAICAAIYLGVSFLKDHSSYMRKAHAVFYLISAWLGGGGFGMVIIGLILFRPFFGGDSVPLRALGIIVGGFIGLGLAMIYDKRPSKRRKSELD